jgi:flagellar M-ring protein FliF
VTEAPVSPELLANYTRLVKDAVGFDEKRGDSVNVVNSSFHVPAAPDEEEPIAAEPIWEKAWVRDLAKVLAGVIVLVILVLRVIKPLVNSLMAAAGSSMQTSAGEFSGGQGALPGGAAAAAAAAGGAAAQSAYEQQIADARAAVQQDPRRVAQVVKGWVGTDG